MPKDSSYASLVKRKQEEFIDVSSVVALPLLRNDEKPQNELPTYVNVRKKMYEYITRWIKRGRGFRSRS